MTFLQRILIIGAGALILALTFELIRRRKLNEEYSLLWLGTGIVLLLFALFPSILYYISGLLHLHYLTTMLLANFLFLTSIVLHFSVIISQHTNRETELTQRLAILEWKLNTLEREKTCTELEDGE